MTDKDFLVLLGKRIKFLRSARHQTQEDLAFDADISKNYLCDVENGRRNITISVLRKICFALEINLEMLFSGLGI